MEITQLLLKISDGDNTVYNELYPLVYNKLRKLAHGQLYKDYSNTTLSKTELVHEVYEKLVDQQNIDYQSRAHFFSIAARCMRQILVDHARKKKTIKAGGNYSRIDLDLGELRVDEHAERILALHELLIQLKEVDERICTVVELRFFVGLSIEETAEILNISIATVNRDWVKARIWLYRQFQKEGLS